MATDIRLKEGLPEITEAVVATYTECSRTSHLGHKPLPSRDAIIGILEDLLDILYPGYWRRQGNLHIGNVEYHVGDLVDGLHDKLTQQIARALRHELDCIPAENHAPLDLERLAQQKTIELLKRLPESARGARSGRAGGVRRAIRRPKAYHEIIFCYPGLEAVSIYRLAHEMLLLGVPIIPCR